MRKHISTSPTISPQYSYTETEVEVILKIKKAYKLMTFEEAAQVYGENKTYFQEDLCMEEDPESSKFYDEAEKLRPQSDDELGYNDSDEELENALEKMDIDEKK